MISFCGRRHVIALIGGVALAAACSTAAPAAKGKTLGTLRVVERAWPGWMKIGPKASTTMHKVFSGASIPLGRGSTATSLHVGGGRDSIEITVENVAPIGKTGGSNLKACGRQQYRLRVGETVNFATCAMDSGTTWTVSRTA